MPSTSNTGIAVGEARASYDESAEQPRERVRVGRLRGAYDVAPW
jgi:hypothetical protein